MRPIPHRHHDAGKRKIRRRLDRPVTAPSPEPILTASNIHYEAAAKSRGIACGGIGAIHLLVRKLELAEAIDERLHQSSRSRERGPPSLATPPPLRAARLRAVPLETWRGRLEAVAREAV